MPTMKMMPALPYAISLVAGLVCGYYCASLPMLMLLAAMVVCILVGCLLHKKPKVRTIPFIVASCIAGMLLMTHALNGKGMLPEGRIPVTAIVTDTPKKTTKGFACDMFVVDGPIKNATIRVNIYQNDSVGVPLALGKTYAFTTRLREFENFNSDGNFNYRRWAESRGYTASAFVGSEYIAETSCSETLPFAVRIPLKAKLMREKILNMFSECGVADQQYAIMAAMAFGDKGSIDQSTRDVYAKTGASHLLALSGMHLGILFVLLSMIFIRSRWEILGRTIVIATIWLYVLLVGMPSSVIRAATMLTIYTIVTMDGRNKMSINALCVTAMLMLIVHPLSIWDVGFQLSFMAMLSIFVFYTPIYNIIHDRFLFRHPVLRKIWGAIAVSTAAQIGTAPLTMYYFGRFSTCFILTNLVAIPLVMILLYCVFFTLILSFVPVLKMVCIWGVKQTTLLLNGFLIHLSSWSGVSIENISISWIQLMLIYSMIIVVTLLVKRLKSISFAR